MRCFPGTIRGRIMACTAALTLLTALLTITACSAVFQYFLKESQLQSAEYNLQIIRNNVSADMENILNFTQWCCSSADISQYMKEFEDQTRMPSISSEDSRLRTMALRTYEQLKEKYHNTHSSAYISRLLLSPVNCCNYMQISDTVASNTSQAAEVVSRQSFFTQLMEAGDYQWIGLIPDPLQTGATEELILPILRPVYNQFNSDIVGWTYLAVSEQIFLDYLGTFPLEEDASIYLTIGPCTYEFSQGRLSQSPSPLAWEVISQIQSPTLDPSTSAANVRLPDGSRRTMITCPLGQEGWSVTQILSTHSRRAQQQIYLSIVACSLLVIGLVGAGLYTMLNRMISRPVGRLLGTMENISRGDFSRDPSIEWEDEFGIIGRGINQMSENVVSLMDKKVEAEKHKKDLEYQILQSQINPHFLYNTLNSIKWMATIQNASGIAEMTTALARLMKNVSKGRTALIPLKEELDLVNDYFLIQQYRYGGSITLECSLASDALNQCLIHRFTLQPIVENALFHGIEPKGCAGSIKILCESREDETLGRILVITVTDDGIGMTQETIDRVLSGNEPPAADFFRQVGVNNVNQRIRYEFGEAYGISIESEPGSYTSMRITLPYQTEGI